MKVKNLSADDVKTEFVSTKSLRLRSFSRIGDSCSPLNAFVNYAQIQHCRQRIGPKHLMLSDNVLVK